MTVINRGRPITFSVAPSGSYPAVAVDAMMNAASDWTASASSTPTGLARGNATESFDVGFVGFEQSAGATVTVTCDLGSALAADFLLLKGWQGSSAIYQPTGITVQFSDNGSDWTTVQTLSGLTGDGQAGGGYWIYRVDVSSSHRYWRATFTHGGDWFFLAAFELHTGWVNHAWGRPYTVAPAVNGFLPNALRMALIAPGMSDWLTGGGKATNAERGTDSPVTAVGWALSVGQTGTLRVDMGSAVGGDHVAVFGPSPTGTQTRTPAAIAIAYSDNDADWTTFFNKTGLANATTAEGTWVARSDISALGDHQYWRVVLTQGSLGDYLGITQFELWAQTASAPSAPTNPAAAEQSCSSILVSWDDVADETGYRVERSANGTTGWADISGNLAADATSYLNTGLAGSTQYFYRVIAFNASGDSDPSTVVDDTTPDCPTGSTRVIRSPRYGVTRVASR